MTPNVDHQRMKSSSSRVILASHSLPDMAVDHLLNPSPLNLRALKAVHRPKQFGGMEPQGNGTSEMRTATAPKHLQEQISGESTLSRRVAGWLQTLPQWLAQPESKSFSQRVKPQKLPKPGNILETSGGLRRQTNERRCKSRPAISHQTQAPVCSVLPEPIVERLALKASSNASWQHGALSCEHCECTVGRFRAIVVVLGVGPANTTLQWTQFHRRSSSVPTKASCPSLRRRRVCRCAARFCS